MASWKLCVVSDSVLYLRWDVAVVLYCYNAKDETMAKQLRSKSINLSTLNFEHN